jgi:predicted MFS family arabinose efflux permease
MLVSDLVRVPLMASLPLLHAAGLLSFPLLLALVAAFGCFWAPYFAAQRSILPELLGDDEKTIAQANSVVEGATYTSGLLGPPIAGVLIAAFGAANVIYIDAATFLFSFVLVLVFVSARRRAVASEESGGVLAGIKFLLRDALMGPLVSVVVLYNAFGQMLVAALPVLAFERYADAKVGGWLFTAFGLGGVVGTFAAFKLVTKVEPLTLAATAVLGIALPIWIFTLDVPLAVLLVALAFSSFANPLVNAPFFGLLTKRTPPALLPKVMTAVLTCATIAGPLGLLAGGWLLENEGVQPTFAVVAAGETAVSLLFIALLARFRRTQALPAPAPEVTM